MNKVKTAKALKAMQLGLQALEAAAALTEIRKKKRRSCKVRKINRDRRRNGFFVVMFKKMRAYDPQQFFLYTRMNAETFELFERIMIPIISKSAQRESIHSECRLAVVLQHLSQGKSIQSLAWSFKLGKETVRSIILECTAKIWEVLFPVYVKEPNASELSAIADLYRVKFGMPNCIGAIDGKHISIQCPPNSGSQFYCYKNFNSIVLLAACDATYKFTFVDVGAYGSQSDGGIFQASSFGRRIISEELSIPPAKELPGRQQRIPHFFAADAAFPLTRHVMRPYPGQLLPMEKQNFNKRLSSARMTIENSFGILAARWRILRTTINMYPENVDNIVLACIALHNFIMCQKTNLAQYCPPTFVDWEDENDELHFGSWRDEVDGFTSIQGARSTNHYGGKQSIAIRNELCNYFNTNSNV